MKFKQLFVSVTAACGLLAASQAMADEVEHSLTITATIPTASFYVTPAGGNWMNDPQDLAMNAVTGELATLTKQLDVKSTYGAITGKLLSPAKISSGTDSIDLDVFVNNTALKTSAGDVISAADAKDGLRVPFQVIPQKKPTNGFVPGQYTGIVNMVFESTPTGP